MKLDWRAVLRYPEKYASGPFTRIYYCRCAYTNEIFISKYKGRRCSSKAALENKRAYQAQCRFRFHTSQFPEIFDQAAIDSVGLYHSVNNPNGLSRDHMFSIEDGWKQKVDPDIISHPANCRLIPHPENLRKRTDSIITLSELLRRIENWYPDGGSNSDHQVESLAF